MIGIVIVGNDIVRCNSLHVVTTKDEKTAGAGAEVVHMVRTGNIYNTTILTISLKRTTKPTLVKGLSILFK